MLGRGTSRCPIMRALICAFAAAWTPERIARLQRIMHRYALRMEDRAPPLLYSLNLALICRCHLLLGLPRP